MSRWLASVLVGLFGSGGLALFYSSVHHRWPESYFGLEDSLDSVVSRSMTFYAGFRAVPVWLATVFVTVTAERLAGFAGLAALALGAAHLGVTNVRGGVQVIRRGGSWTLIVYHAVATLLLAGVVFVGYKCYPLFGAAVPQPSAVTEALWTALFAAILVSSLYRLAGSVRDTRQLIRRASRDVGLEIVERVNASASRCGCDPVFLRSILFAEALQRPRWVRRAERVKSILVKPGSYGVMQVSSTHVLSDDESIQTVAENYAGYWPLRSESGWILPGRFAAQVERHNLDKQFVEMVTDLYQEMAPYPEGRTKSRSQLDHRAIVEVLKTRRHGATWELEGTTTVPDGDLVARFMQDDDGNWRWTDVASSLGGVVRANWQIVLPLSVTQLWVGERGMETETPFGAKFGVHIDLQYAY